jgi:hypothetical protein
MYVSNITLSLTRASAHWTSVIMSDSTRRDRFDDRNLAAACSVVLASDDPHAFPRYYYNSLHMPCLMTVKVGCNYDLHCPSVACKSLTTSNVHPCVRIRTHTNYISFAN